MKACRINQQVCALVAIQWFAAYPTLASCWHDPQVVQMAHSIAQRGFPNAAARPPEVLVCDGQHFGQNIGGDYTSGVHRIRIPVWQLQSGQLDSVVAHELAHAEVALQLGSQHAGGHARHFFAALLRAGYKTEAERVARYVGGQGELTAALTATGAGQSPPDQPADPPHPPIRRLASPPRHIPPPQVWVQACQPVTVALWCRLPNGEIRMQYQIQNRCHLVPGGAS